MTECLLWDGYIDRAGYGRFGRCGYVHRRAWEEVHGPIPKGQNIHHLCGEKTCVNVEHMELLSTAAHARFHVREKWQPGGALRSVYGDSG